MYNTANASKELTMKAIKDQMTAFPHTINAEKNLKFAENKMKELSVRHLPVLKAGKLIGIISERDIQFVESFEKLDLSEILVEEAFTNEPFCVESTEELSKVCAEMAERKIGSAMVTQDGQLVGIFTWIDALKYLAKS